MVKLVFVLGMMQLLKRNSVALATSPFQLNIFCRKSYLNIVNFMPLSIMPLSICTVHSYIKTFLIQ